MREHIQGPSHSNALTAKTGSQEATTGLVMRYNAAHMKHHRGISVAAERGKNSVRTTPVRVDARASAVYLDANQSVSSEDGSERRASLDDGQIQANFLALLQAASSIN
jgi:hypothetical protein